MKTSAFSHIKNCIRFDKRCVIAYLITVILAIISGIVLCSITQINPYMLNYASEYVYFVYNFKNASLFFPRLFFGLLYGYLYYLIACCTRFRLLALPVLFLRTMMSAVYTALIISVTAFGGIIVAVTVYIPSSLVCLALNLLLIETCRLFNKKFSIFLPAAFALFCAVFEWLLVNILFRMIIAVP